jgi:membrane protease YdiL (CAAX protease family)
VTAGFLLGGLYAATGNLVAPVVAHFTINAVNLYKLSRDFASDAAPTRR